MDKDSELPHNLMQRKSLGTQKTTKKALFSIP
jgi:hypothetical protein